VARDCGQGACASCRDAFARFGVGVMLGVLPVIQGQARAAVWQGAGSAVCDEFTVSGAGSTGAGGASCPSAWGNPAGQQARAVVAARGGVGSPNDAQARETGQGLPRAGTARQAEHSTAGAPPCAGSPKSRARCAVGRPRSSICPPARLASAFALVSVGLFSAGRRAGHGVRHIANAARAVPFLVASTLPAVAHEAPSGWRYDIECCSQMDCQPVPASMIRATSEGWRIEIPPGGHKMAPTGFVGTLPYDSHRVRQSQDGLFHPCIAPAIGSHRPEPVLLCLYVPEMGS